MSKQKENKKCKCRGRFLMLIIIFLAGIWVGIHRKVLLAWLKGEEIPTPPDNHCWHTFCKKKDEKLQ